MIDPEQKSALILPFTPKDRLLTGGKGPPNDNWLYHMVPGTRFLAKRKNYAGSEVDDYVVYTNPQDMPVVLLAKNTYARDSDLSWHDPAIFSQQHKLYMILEVLEPKNGNSDKIPTKRLASDVKPKVIHPVDEAE